MIALITRFTRNFLECSKDAKSMVQAKSPPPKANVRVYADKGSLALRFSTKYNPIFEQLSGFTGKQKCMGLGMADTEQSWKKAQQTALQIEADLEHSDWVKLFDPTFAKYGIGEAKYAQKLADVINLPTATPQMTVGELWEDYLNWKEGQVQPTTFKKHFKRTITNAIKGLKYDKANGKLLDTGIGIYVLPLDATIGEKAVILLQKNVSSNCSANALAALREAFDYAVNLGKIPPTKNPFVVAKGETSSGQIYAPKQDEDGVWREWWYFEDATKDEYLKDTKHYSLSERDAIIKAFYEADTPSKRHAAHLIEFLFLTGCRHGEAFGLRWKDVSFERGYLRFSKSFDKQTHTTKCTKNDTIRMFKLYPPLIKLLLRIQGANTKVGKNDLVFTLMSGGKYGSDNLDEIWRGRGYTYTSKSGERTKYSYPGIVTLLAQEGAIGGYLNPYSTRHTFITLQAQAGVDLMLLAAICGNSVDVINRHYLGIDESAELVAI